jgi:hypothetical protein
MVPGRSAAECLALPAVVPRPMRRQRIRADAVFAGAVSTRGKYNLCGVLQITLILGGGTVGDRVSHSRRIGIHRCAVRSSCPDCGRLPLALLCHSCDLCAAAPQSRRVAGLASSRSWPADLLPRPAGQLTQRIVGPVAAPALSHFEMPDAITISGLAGIATVDTGLRLKPRASRAGEEMRPLRACRPC